MDYEQNLALNQGLLGFVSSPVPDEYKPSRLQIKADSSSFITAKLKTTVETVYYYLILVAFTF